MPRTSGGRAAADSVMAAGQTGGRPAPGPVPAAPPAGAAAQAAAGPVAAAAHSRPSLAAPSAPAGPAKPAAGAAAAPAGQPAPAQGRAGLLPGGLSRLPQLLRRHWLAALLLAAGVAARALVQVAYRPAIVYIDSVKYLYNAWAGADPVGYKGPLKLILLAGNLQTVAVVQHLLGLAIAVALYALLVRRGAPRWLAAIAVAPVLLDAYQLQSEQMIMPDIWFEALIVAGLAVLAWKPRPGPRACIAAGLLLGSSVTMRQVGEILVLPAVIFVVAAGSGWRRTLASCGALCAAFAVPVLAYCGVSYALNGHFALSYNGVAATYGRMAAAADCPALRIPAGQRALCPAPAEQKVGPDRLDHDNNSPVKLFNPPPGSKRNAAIGEFNRAVLLQQPLRVLGAIGRDAAKLFAITRITRQGDTPISRWQFQREYPVYYPTINLSRTGTIIVGLPPKQPGGPVLDQALNAAYGSQARVSPPLARFLRAYQLEGGYAPGPLLLLAAMAALTCSLAAFRRRRASPEGRQLTLACLLFFSCAVADLMASDLFEFSWRYQLPALVTLWPAGVLAAAAALRLARARRERSAADRPADRSRRSTVPAGS